MFLYRVASAASVQGHLLQKRPLHPAASSQQVEYSCWCTPSATLLLHSDHVAHKMRLSDAVLGQVPFFQHILPTSVYANNKPLGYKPGGLHNLWAVFHILSEAPVRCSWGESGAAQVVTGEATDQWTNLFTSTRDFIQYARLWKNFLDYCDRKQQKCLLFLLINTIDIVVYMYNLLCVFVSQCSTKVHFISIGEAHMEAVAVYRLNVPLHTLQVISGTIFTGQMTKPTVSKHWRKTAGRQDQAWSWIPPEPLHHVTIIQL